LGLLEKIFGHKFEDIIQTLENYKRRSILKYAISNYSCAKSRRTKWATFEINILELKCSLKFLSRRPYWGRSRKTCCDCRRIME